MGVRPLRAATTVLLSVLALLLAGGVAHAAPAPRDPDVVQAALDRVATAAPDTVTGWYVDPADRKVVVETTDVPAARAFVALAGVAGDDVRIVPTAQRPRPLAALDGGQTMRHSGGATCSTGFNARGGGRYYVVTAGSCTALGNTWYIGTTPLGTVARDGGTDGPGTIAVDTTRWSPTARIQGGVTIAGSTAAPVGARVCVADPASGYRCGVIQGKNQTVNNGGGDIVYGLTRTSVCVQGARPGAPFVTDRQAQGVLYGGTGTCASGGSSYFQPVNEALARYGLQLLTG